MELCAVFVNGFSSLSGGAGEVALQSTAGVDAAGGVARKSTRAWAVGSNYDPIKLFTKVTPRGSADIRHIIYIVQVQYSPWFSRSQKGSGKLRCI